MLKRIFVFQILLWGTLNLLSLDPKRLISQYQIEFWNQEKGLRQNTVRCILQTDDGYVWIGTEEGLIRFDGKKFTVFDMSNIPKLVSNFIVTLYEDSRHRLWIGTRSGGVILFHGGKFKVFDRSAGLPNLVVNAIGEDEKGLIWAGTDGEGIVYYRQGRFYPFNWNHQLPDQHINAIIKDHKNQMWVATNNGVAAFLLLGFTILDENNGIESKTIKTLAEDHENNLWIGTARGLYKGKDNRFSRVLPDGVELDERIYNIYCDRDENIWIGTATHGLVRYQKGTFEFLNKENGLQDNTILSITSDTEGNLWVGSAFNGVHCLKNGKFLMFGKPEGLTDDIAFAVMEDSRGYIWVGTNRHLNRLKGSQVMPFLSLSNPTINAIYEDSQGFIWVGTDEGLNQLKSFPDKIEKKAEYFRGDWIGSIYEDKKGNIWVGTVGQFYRMSKGKFSVVPLLPGEKNLVVTAITEDRSGNIFCGTYRRGLIQIQQGKIIHYDYSKGLNADSINAIHIDETGVIWLATVSGIVRFANGSFFDFTIRDGLFSNSIHNILEDNHKNFWCSTNKGIFMISRSDLEAYHKKAIKSIPFTLYDKEDGMRNSECNGGFQSAGGITKDGRLLFPTMKGMVLINPGQMNQNKFPPLLHIEKVTIDGFTMDYLTSQIVVPPSGRRIEIYYTGLNFTCPQKIQFQYQMENFDKAPVLNDISREQVATYTNLSPGQYTFRLNARNSDGIWNKKEVSLNVIVLAPIWRKWWFVGFAFLVFAIVSYFLIHFIRQFFKLSAFWKGQKHIGQYRIVSKIDSGGMGIVYRATHLIDRSQVVALKVLREELTSDPTIKRRFKQEGAIIDQFDDPHIVKIIERGEHKNRLYIAMELLQGRTLAQRLNENGPFTIPEALSVMIQLTETLVRIHRKNIVHRDMKPANIMLVVQDGNANYVKLLDFGLARMAFHTRYTQTGMAVGTLQYMSPEQVGSGNFSAASDVYALGVIFYEMITGKLPFMAETTSDLMRRILNDPVKAPLELKENIPSGLNGLIIKMLTRDDKARPTAQEVVSTLYYLQKSQ